MASALTLPALPSLGATTGVPGAAGAAIVAGPASPGTVNITVPLGDAPKDVQTNVQSLFGQTWSSLWGNTVTPRNEGDDPAAVGDEVVSGPASINGSLDDLLAWLRDNWQIAALVVVAIFLLMYAISAATRK